MPSNKYEKKRKRELDIDTTRQPRKERRDEDGEEQRPRRNRSPSSKKSRQKESKRRDSSPEGNGNDESLSIEETNKLRAKLGLAPLELEDKSNTEPVEKEDGSGEKVFTEDGVEIVHKAPKNWSEEKRAKELKEKLELRKKQREVQSKVLKARKTLAEESDEELDNAAKWVERNRKMEEELKKAEQKSKMLDEMDEAFGVGGMIQAEQQRHRMDQRRKKEAVLTAGLVVGHSMHDFSEGKETVLVLQDKGILEDDEDEVLINPNMVENEKHKLNMERRKRKDNYQPYEEEVDEFGQLKKQDILAKYNEGLDGDHKKRETFRLDVSGQYDLDKETQEQEARRRLMMLNKKFETLDESSKYTLAKEFYTEEEIIQFRRPKKKGAKSARKRKALKADDLVPEVVEETEEERKARETKLATRRADRREQTGITKTPEKKSEFRETLREASSNGGEEREEGELVEEEKVERRKEEAAAAGEKWKKAQPSVNVQMLSELAEKMKKAAEGDSEESDEEALPHCANAAPILIEDEAEDELNAVLAKTRRLRQSEQMDNAEKWRAAMKQEQESSSEDEEGAGIMMGGKGSIVFDATSEKYKAIGGGYSQKTSSKKNEVKMELNEDEWDNEDEMLATSKQARKKKRSESGESEVSDLTRLERERENSGESGDEEPSADYTNILGEEKDVTKGVAAMLKLAGEKGYLEPGHRRKDEGKLKHLESKRFSKVEQGRYDIEDKTMRKLERMGTTGTGPTRPFPEKAEYAPKIEINYADQKGRILDSKEAFRELSWKFHGKGPGKKQAEKHAAKVVKREKLKKMNSSDTPLGTLNKQLKKQEQLQTPYLVLSGRGEGQPLQKE